MIHDSKYRYLLIAALACVALFTIAIAISLGSTDIPIPVTIRGIVQTFFPDSSAKIPLVESRIISDIRLPRALLGMATGAGLAICGLVTQSLLRNPLGDPYLLGISSGASAGAALVIVMGGSIAFLGSLGISLGAFIGALISLVIVSTLSMAGGRVTTNRIIFAGMAVNYLFSAITSLLVLTAKTAAGSKSITFWMMGSLGNASWKDVTIASMTLIFIFTIFYILGRRVDLLNLGDDTARSLGTNPGIYRSVLFLTIALAVAIFVSLTGAIGFIGLIVPHVAKILVGGITRAALPVAAFCGAILVVLADTAARLLLRPTELPLGILTALIGAPLLMGLIKNHAS